MCYSLVTLITDFVDVIYDSYNDKIHIHKFVIIIIRMMLLITIEDFGLLPSLIYYMIVYSIKIYSTDWEKLKILI